MADAGTLRLVRCCPTTAEPRALNEPVVPSPPTICVRVTGAVQGNQADEDGQQDALDEDCAAPEAARSDEAAAGSVALSVARVPHRPGKWRRAVRRYYTWAELLRRVFRVEIFTCPNCGGARRLLAAIKDPDSIERVMVGVAGLGRDRRA